MRALDAKKRVAIHGATNSFMIFSQRLSPRSMVVKVARKIMEPWFKER